MSEKWDDRKVKTVAADLVVSQTTMIYLLFSINYLKKIVSKIAASFG